MPTHAELASKLLSDAATFFRTLAEQNDELKEQMSENATVFEQMADLIVNEPQGRLEDTSHSELAGRLLVDAAGFFRSLADQNEPIKEQMGENANIYEQLGKLVAEDPLGILD